MPLETTEDCLRDAGSSRWGNGQPPASAGASWGGHRRAGKPIDNKGPISVTEQYRLCRIHQRCSGRIKEPVDLGVGSSTVFQLRQGTADGGVLPAPGGKRSSWG